MKSQLSFTHSRFWKAFLLVVLVVLLFDPSRLLAQRDDPENIPPPDTVTIAGTIQTQLGCSGDWNTGCEETMLTYDPENDLWSATFDLAAGSYEYKVALNGTWDDNYGLNGEYYGPNIPLEVAEDGPVTFWYDHKSRWVYDSINSDVADGLPVLQPAVGSGGGAASMPPPAVVAMPDLVVIPGTLQDELGCTADWAPDCEETALAFDEEDQLWVGTFTIPAGDYEYKVALNGTWDVNFGREAQPGGANIPLSLPEETAVTFYFSTQTGWVTDNVSSIIANVPGDYQDEIGCPGEWAPDCLRSWLQDPDGDGRYVFMTDAIPAGSYEAKVAVDQSWGENYGEGGAQDGANIPFTVGEDGTLVTFVWDANSKVMTIAAGGAGPAGNLNELMAHWVTADTIAWDVAADDGYTYNLYYSPTGGSLSLGAEGVTGGESIPLAIDPASLPPAVQEKFPHLAGYTTLKISEDDLRKIRIALKGQVAVSITDAAGELVGATGLQIPGVLDDLYTYAGPLGATYADGTPTLRVWAPTAQSVNLVLFNNSVTDAGRESLPMRIDPNTGVWSITGLPDWDQKFYLYEVRVYAPGSGLVTNLVTDPYSVSLSRNSTRSQIVNLADADLMPAGWEAVSKPPLAAPEDIVVYELHLRDFSVYDTSVPPDLRGTYAAFTIDSRGMEHLSQLAAAGVSHLHLLPTFDIATINEDPGERVEPNPAQLAQFPEDSPEPQSIIGEVRDQDGFNWGYDPYHYTVPEGSYSTEADGVTRIIEYRDMVRALNETGLRVVMDVVYNHTNASGQSDRSVLDRIVPGYYHRLNNRGRVETTTCCQNTATEHHMMRKLMIDSLLTWAREYKIDGFRFDLMGHHMLEDMLAVRQALDSLTLADDGVDGSAIYVYGEGWNFGEVADNQRGVNATQFNTAGTGIGTFNDRLRDAARGGSPFGGQQEQGFINGLYFDPNATGQGPEAEQLDRLLHFADLIRVGLAGNLADYEFEGSGGDLVTGADVDYNNSPAGYTADPQENIVYVSKHDNETLFDVIQYKAPVDTPMAERVRMQFLGNSIVMFSQGIPFFQAGDDMLRSKSLDRNSYNAGDWFNALDWSYQTNNWGKGLPAASDNESMWPVMAELLANPDLMPTQEDIIQTTRLFRELAQIRESSPLFRLRTAADVQERLSFHNTGPDQIPGVIVMSISDLDGENLDPDYGMIAVVFNANDTDLIFTDPGAAGIPFTLHPVQARSIDPQVRTATFAAESATFTLPGRTTAVFVLTEADAAALATAEVSEMEETVREEAEEHAAPITGDDIRSALTFWLVALGGGLLIGLLAALGATRNRQDTGHH